jgi:uncharacterized protein YceK
MSNYVYQSYEKPEISRKNTRNIFFTSLICAMLMLMLAIIGACSTTQCATAQKLFDTANKGYATAQAAGATKEMDKYKWAADSAEAMLQMWCAGVAP